LLIITPDVIHVRTEGDATARACKPADLTGDDRSVAISANTEIALEKEGPFEKAGIAVERDGALRDALAAAIPTPSSSAWSRVRWPVLGAALLPALGLVELDRELLTAGRFSVSSGGARLLVHLALGAYIAWELTRKTPR